MVEPHKTQNRRPNIFCDMLIGWLKIARSNSDLARHCCCPVFRFRSRIRFAVSSHANFGIKGTLAILMFSSAALDLKFLQEPAAN